MDENAIECSIQSWEMINAAFVEKVRIKKKIASLVGATTEREHMVFPHLRETFHSAGVQHDDILCHFHYILLFHLFFIYIFLGAPPYTLYFITLARCLNNEYEDNQEIQQEFDFERMSCTDDTGSEEYMDDELYLLKWED